MHFIPKDRIANGLGIELKLQKRRDVIAPYIVLLVAVVEPSLKCIQTDVYRKYPILGWFLIFEKFKNNFNILNDAEKACHVVFLMYRQH